MLTLLCSITPESKRPVKVLLNHDTKTFKLAMKAKVDDYQREWTMGTYSEVAFNLKKEGWTAE